MGTITSGIGLASGIDTGNIIEQLIQLERRPITTLQSRIATTSQTQIAYTELSTKLNALKNLGTNLRKPSLFDAVLAKSGNEDVAKAEARTGAPVGRYELRVGSLVQSQQAVTEGFASKTATAEAGQLTIEVGGGQLQVDTALADLNAGEGVGVGKFRLTDAAGRSTVFDSADFATLEDVVEAINLNLDVDVTAEIRDGALFLSDESGGAGTLRVRDLAGGTAAADLSIAEDTRAGATRTTINGGSLGTTDAEKLDALRAVPLADLNGGAGLTYVNGEELRVRTGDGVQHDVLLGTTDTVGAMIDQFNAELGGAAVMSLDPNTGRFTVTDLTGSTSQQLRVQSRNGSNVAEDLGIALTAAPGETSVSSGSSPIDVDAAYDAAGLTVSRPGGIPTSELRGGAGISAGSFTITDRLGNSATIDANTGWLDEIIENINDSGIGVIARLNDAGNGIALDDTTGGTGDLIIADSAGTAAADLGIAGSFASDSVDGGNLQRQWISEATRLDQYDIGQPVGTGVISFTDSAGATAEIDLSVGTFDTLGDIINAVNDLGIGVTARVNDNGDGLLIEDTAGGANPLKIEDVDGSAATALRIAGEHDDGSADGSFEAVVDIEAGATLEEVVKTVNELGFGVRASLVNDGSAEAPWRLSLTARDTGTAGAFTFDAGTTGLGTRNVAKARDAVVFLGGDGLEPLKITSSTNRLEDALPGLSIDLFGTNEGKPIEITVGEDQDAAVAEVQALVEAFNALRDSIDERTSYNQETDKRGALLGEPAVQRAERKVYRLVEQTYPTGNPRFRILSDVGLRIGKGAKLEFNEEKFRAAWAEDAEAVKKMFTATVDGENVGFGHRLQDAVSELTDPVDGLVTRAVDQLETKTKAFEDQIAKIEESVLTKQARLQKQFLDMELALSKLQFQQQQLSAIPNLQAQQSSGGSGGGG